MENENKEKPENVDIKTITADSTELILGIGNDNQVYFWSRGDKKWYLY